MKKIAYLHQYFCKPDMNGNIRSYEFAKRLSKDGYNVHIITTDRENVFKGWRVEEVEGFTVHWVSVKYDNSFGFFARVIAFLKFSILMLPIILKIKPDFVFATSTPLTIAIPALFAKILFKIPYIFEVRDLWPDAPIKFGMLKNPILIWLARKLEYYSYSFSNHVIALSPEMAAGIQLTGIDSSKITIIPNSSDVSVLRYKDPEKVNKFWIEKGLNNNENNIVVYTGTIGLVNDLIYLVDLAYVSKKHLKTKYVVFGQGGEKEKVINYAQEKGVLDYNLYFFNPVSKSDLGLVLAGSKMTMSLVADVPALWGNSANKFFDAFAAAKPIMINYGGWQADVIKENQCGVVVDRDVQKASKVVHDFIENKSSLLNAEEASKFLGDNVYGRDVLYQKLKNIFDTKI